MSLLPKFKFKIGDIIEYRGDEGTIRITWDDAQTITVKGLREEYPVHCETEEEARATFRRMLDMMREHSDGVDPEFTMFYPAE